METIYFTFHEKKVIAELFIATMTAEQKGDMRVKLKCLLKSRKKEVNIDQEFTCNESRPTYSQIVTDTCKFLSVDENAIRDKSRKGKLNEARQFITYLIIVFYDPSYVKVGEEKHKDYRIKNGIRKIASKAINRGGPDITSILTKVENYLTTDEKYRSKLQYLEHEMKTNYSLE
jgi:hypothetical protein